MVVMEEHRCKALMRCFFLATNFMQDIILRDGGPEKGAKSGELRVINPKFSPIKGQRGNPFEARCEVMAPVRSHTS